MCNAAGVGQYGQAVTMANVSDVALALGGVALATDAAVFFTAPKTGASSTAVELRVVPVATGDAWGLWITGRW
jgi:hypothetical protein